MLPLVRAALVLVQALTSHMAFLPPNKTPWKGRYHTEEAYILQVAPSIFKLHSVLLWFIAAYEAVYAFNHYLANRSHVITPLFLKGVLLTVIGMFIRLRCFQELGQLFTFDLSILPDHRLVTSGSYGYVRHPSYTGSMLIVIGITFSQFTMGSLATECGVIGPVGSLVLCTMWWIWTLSVAVSRAIAEDKKLQKLFGPEWDAYAATTKFWFVPGLY